MSTLRVDGKGADLAMIHAMGEALKEAAGNGTKGVQKTATGGGAHEIQNASKGDPKAMVGKSGPITDVGQAQDPWAARPDDKPTRVPASQARGAQAARLGAVATPKKWSQLTSAEQQKIRSDQHRSAVSGAAVDDPFGPQPPQPGLKRGPSSGL